MCFNMDGAVNKLYPILTADDSPLEHVKKIMDDSYLLRHRRLDLSNTITYGPSDHEANNEDPLFKQARRALGFQERSELIHEWDYTSPEDIRALKEIRKYLHDKGIGEFVLADWEEENFLAGGTNGKREISNSRPEILDI